MIQTGTRSEDSRSLLSVHNPRIQLSGLEAPGRYSMSAPDKMNMYFFAGPTSSGNTLLRFITTPSIKPAFNMPTSRC